MPTEKTVIVLGVGRCGSSMIGGILSNLGVFMGQHLLPANEYNVHGYYEDEGLMQLQDALLSSMGCNWWQPPKNALVALGFGDPAIAQKLCDAINQRTENEHLFWGFKDPRTIYLLPVYRKLLVNPHFICVHRNMLSVARSIHHRDKRIIGDSIGEAIALAARHHAQLVHTINDPWMADKPIHHIVYEDALGQPTECVDRIMEFLDIEDICGKQYTETIYSIDPRAKTW